MKVIYLNTWGGRYMEGLMGFVRRWAQKADVFCFQEVHHSTQEHCERRSPNQFVRWDLWNKLQDYLPDFRGYLATFDDDPYRMSQAMCLRRSIRLEKYDATTIYSPEQPLEAGDAIESARKVQSMIIPIREKKVAIINYHGLWTPQGKLDSPERLEQSRRLREYLARFSMPTIFGGDMNLEPRTQSMALLKEGMVDLVGHYGVRSTRTVLYREYDNPQASKHADYLLASPTIVVNSFRVLGDIASDHAALYLDFSL